MPLVVMIVMKMKLLIEIHKKCCMYKKIHVQFNFMIIIIYICELAEIDFLPISKKKHYFDIVCEIHKSNLISFYLRHGCLYLYTFTNKITNHVTFYLEISTSLDFLFASVLL